LTRINAATRERCGIPAHIQIVMVER